MKRQFVNPKWCIPKHLAPSQPPCSCWFSVACLCTGDGWGGGSVALSTALNASNACCMLPLCCMMRCAGATPPTYVDMNGIDCNGSDIPGASSIGTNNADCRSRCDALPNCVAYVFRPSDGACYLKSGMGTQQPNGAVTCYMLPTPNGE